ncbi:MAG: hypothetical protein ACFE8L_04505 [Candidatus Hodarchaeota archaeon]
MLYTILDDLIYYQIIQFRKRFSNKELLLFKYFHEKTKVYPQNIIIIGKFVFFFVKNEYYFKANRNLKYIRRQSQDKKLIIIRAENTLIKLLIGFFPDLYIHNIAIEMNVFTGKKHIVVGVLSYEERAIAIGCNGDYIKAVNKLLENFVIFENNGTPIKIECKVVSL